MVITTQNPDGTFSGAGGYPAGSAPYTAVGQTPETITGQVTGNTITFTTTYTGPFNPGYSVTVSGTIAPDGSMSGATPFEWHTTSGNATLPGSLAAQDFGVVNYDTGLGILKGYTAGFGLTDATFAGVQSVVVKLYASSTLLQTNTATPKVSSTITGSDISSPFDVSGSFNYVTDGYWTNVRETQYGQSVPATRVVATVTLANGKVVTAENDTLTGDPTTIMPTSTGSLTVQKIARGGHGTFTFTGDGGIGSFQITTATSTGSQTFSNLAPGTYHVTEATTTGWTITSNGCSAIVVAASGTAQCTITNTIHKDIGEAHETMSESKDKNGSGTVPKNDDRNNGNGGNGSSGRRK
jgi:hypothetical protein